ncbi:hypothetical protein [Saccharopolyspora pogona]|uniref:hypothetical protein n=1 Tax=Saccharopolyspora pogona TaxID=333966 RepID=UPI0016845879|nr:hypothetical protein [Saccharopolyspora pogona]
MSITKRMKAVATSVVLGTAISTAAVVGFAGPANAAARDASMTAAVREFKLCNNGKSYSVFAQFADSGGFSTYMVYPGKCTTAWNQAGRQYQLVFESFSGRKRITKLHPTATDANTKVVTWRDGDVSVYRY